MTTRRTSGNVMMEYLVVCAALVFALFVPIQDNSSGNGQGRTAMQLVIDSFRDAYQKFSFATSLPS